MSLHESSTLSPAQVNDLVLELTRGEGPAGPPGSAELPEESPVHVVYGGAHLYRADSPASLASFAGESAR